MKIKQCFTLIELLVVIVIIAILAGLLMPALNQVRKKVTVLECKNNLKQFALIGFNYADDFDGWGFHIQRYDSAMAFLRYGLDGDVYPNQKGIVSYMRCPSSDVKKFPGMGKSFGTEGSSDFRFITSYLMAFGGDYKSTFYSNDGWWFGFRITGFPKQVPNLKMLNSTVRGYKIYGPAQQPMLGDITKHGTGGLLSVLGCVNFSPPHNDEGQNAVFLDGHVSWFTRAQIVQKTPNTMFKSYDWDNTLPLEL